MLISVFVYFDVHVYKYKPRQTHFYYLYLLSSTGRDVQRWVRELGD